MEDTVSMEVETLQQLHDLAFSFFTFFPFFYCRVEVVIVPSSSSLLITLVVLFLGLFTFL